MTVRAVVKEIPSFNNDIDVIRSESLVGGCGYEAVRIPHLLAFPYVLMCPVGSGVYGDYVSGELEKIGIKVYAQSNELAGCMYELTDEKGSSTAFINPGCEYSFSYADMQDIDPEEVYCVIVSSEVLAYDDGEEVLAAIEDLGKPVYFFHGERFIEVSDDALERLADLKPVMVLSESDAREYAQDYPLEHIHAFTGNDVLLLRQNEGVVWFDGNESRMVPYRDTMSLWTFVGAYVCARESGVDIGNGILFACEACDISRSGVDLKKRLAGMILGH